MASLSGFTEAGIGIILLLLCLGIIITAMNLDYNQNYDSTFGLGTNETKSAFEEYQGTLDSGLSSEATTGTDGLNVIGSWGIIKAGLSMVLNMVTGQWIQNAIGLMQLGSVGLALGWALRLLFIFAIGFILIKILFKVKP